MITVDLLKVLDPFQVTTLITLEIFRIIKFHLSYIMTINHVICDHNCQAQSF
jgi:hypothetical protein